MHGRRFLNRLPPHMQHLNYTLVQTLVPVGLQSVEEIETIVHQATRPTTWPKCAQRQPPHIAVPWGAQPGRVFAWKAGACKHLHCNYNFCHITSLLFLGELAHAQPPV